MFQAKAATELAALAQAVSVAAARVVADEVEHSEQWTRLENKIEKLEKTLKVPRLFSSPRMLLRFVLLIENLEYGA